MNVNLHTHTARCRHAAGEDRDYVEAALAAGIRVLGFSDHCPWPRTAPFPPPGYRSGVRMDPEEAEGYCASLLALRKEYAGRIDLRIGFEVEHLPWRVAAQDELFSRLPVDYLILGQHFLDEEWDGPYCGNPTDDEARLARYVDRCIDGMSTGRYLYLAHPDMIRFTGPEDAYARHMGRLCDFLRERGLLRASVFQFPVVRQDAVLQLAHQAVRETLYGPAGVADQFPIDNFDLIQAMMQIIRNGGLGNGGSNFDAKLRRNSTDPEDIFIAHICGMDAMARALLNAADLLENSPICQMVKERYASFDSGEGKRFEEGKMTLEELVDYAKAHGEPTQHSGKQELYEAIVNMYIK